MKINFKFASLKSVSTESQLTDIEQEKLLWLLKPDLKSNLSLVSKLKQCSEQNCLCVEFGPRYNFKTAFSTNACSICDAVGFNGKINRIERSVIYKIMTKVCLVLKNEIKNLKKMLKILFPQSYKFRVL